jgi:glycosyltransferase involved in cell wall biosynthesis
MNNINNFSVIIPCYNSSKTIIETLKSLANQTYKDFEIVISDDCSNDNSLEKISKLKIKNLKLIKNNINRGYGPNLEIARKNAKYDKIFIIAQDDCIAPKL